MSEIAMFDIRYRIPNAGPSPDGENLRTELYFAGCSKALSGNPCPECFNTMIWTRNRALVRTPEEFLEVINAHKVPKFLTIVGGEPTDQLEGLMEFGRLAKIAGYHIILFSYHDKTWLEEHLGQSVYDFDIIVPGEYRKEERIYDDTVNDGLHNFIGSGNQLVWVPAENFSARAGDILSMSLDKNHILEVKFNDGSDISLQQ